MSVVIPEGVTEIEYDAFDHCSNLTSVSIASSVTKIDNGVFFKCENLKSVYCYATKIPETEKYAFGSAPIYGDDFDVKSAILYVPASVINEYKTTEPWNKFGTILPIEDGTTRIDATSSNCDIKAYGSVITVSDCRDGESVSVYSVSGQLIGATTIKNGSAVIKTNLQAGSVVIVKIGQKSVKLTLN